MYLFDAFLEKNNTKLFQNKQDPILYLCFGLLDKYIRAQQMMIWYNLNHFLDKLMNNKNKYMHKNSRKFLIVLLVSQVLGSPIKFKSMPRSSDTLSICL